MCIKKYMRVGVSPTRCLFLESRTPRLPFSRCHTLSRSTGHSLRTHNRLQSTLSPTCVVHWQFASSIGYSVSVSTPTQILHGKKNRPHPVPVSVCPLTHTDSLPSSVYWVNPQPRTRSSNQSPIRSVLGGTCISDLTFGFAEIKS